jgi:predicted metal-dependent peptidase
LTRGNFGVTRIESVDKKYTTDADHITTSKKSFEITLNDEALGSAGKEYIAATILHEVLHAYFASRPNFAE